MNNKRLQSAGKCKQSAGKRKQNAGNIFPWYKDYIYLTNCYEITIKMQTKCWHFHLLTTCSKENSGKTLAFYTKLIEDFASSVLVSWQQYFSTIKMTWQFV